MGGKIARLLTGILCIVPLAWAPAGAATVAEIIAKIKPLKNPERLNYLLKGAQAEGELVYYGTLPIDEFLPLARVFNARHPALLRAAGRHSQPHADGSARRAARRRRDSGRSELRLSIAQRQSGAA